MLSIIQVVNQFRASRQAKEAESAQALLHSYEQAYSRLKADYQALSGYITAQQQDGTAVKVWRLNQLERYRQLKYQLLRESEILAQQAGLATFGLQAEMGQIGQDLALQASLAGGAALNVPIAGVWNHLPHAAVIELTGALRDGSPLRGLINSLGTTAGEDLEARLIEQLTLGWNPRHAAALLKNSVDLSRARALTILRTEGNRAFHSSAIASYQANEDLIKGYERLCARNRRTCAPCWALDGTFYTLDTPFSEHPNGRCTPIPVMKGHAQAIPGRKPAASVFPDLPEVDQVRILGVRAHGLYKAGELQLKNFVQHTHSDTWGAGIAKKPLYKLFADKQKPKVGGKGPPKRKTSPTKPIQASEPTLPKPDVPTTEGLADALAGDVKAYLTKQGKLAADEIEKTAVVWKSTYLKGSIKLPKYLDKVPGGSKFKALLDPAAPVPVPAPVPKKPRVPRSRRPRPEIPTTTEPAVAPDVFPANLRTIEVVRSLGGSTGADLVKDTTTGRLFVRKLGASAEHLREEALADEIYRAFGARVPRARVYTVNGKPVKLAEHIEGETLEAYLAKATKEEREGVLADLGEHFADDALMGNWDVAGMSLDNILVDAKGLAWRIDNGGSLRYRAQGGLKTGWKPHVTELWSMRNPATNPQTSRLFGRLGMPEIRKQIANLDDRYAAARELLPDDIARLMDERMAALRGYARAYDDMVDDHFRPEYVDSFLKHLAQMRDAGVVDKLAAKMSNIDVSFRDEAGREFDAMRGTSSVIEAFERYVKAQGGDYKHIRNWAGEQGGSSWGSRPVGVKHWFATRRNVDLEEYYWHKTADRGLSTFEKGNQLQGADVLDTTYTAWHALQYHVLGAMDFKNNDRVNRMVHLMRTEDALVMRMYNIEVGDTRAIKRGACESFSLVRKVSVAGSELTEQDLPHHRIFGMYFWSPTPGTDSTFFLSDRENEFVAMAHDILATYRDGRRRR